MVAVSQLQLFAFVLNVCVDVTVLSGRQTIPQEHGPASEFHAACRAM